jgi:hypothetical protein
MRFSLSAPAPGLAALAFASVSLVSLSAFADPAKMVAVTGDALGRLEAVYVAPGGTLLRKRENGAGWDAAITLAAAPVEAVALALNCPTAVPASTATHAAEVIEDGAQWYVSSAGVEQGANALRVAPLTWLNGN